MGLGKTNEKRQAAYRELFRNELKPEIIEEIRQATNGDFALGSERFKEEMALFPSSKFKNRSDSIVNQLHNFVG